VIGLQLIQKVRFIETELSEISPLARIIEDKKKDLLDIFQRGFR
jgi:hypothetical protein